MFVSKGKKKQETLKAKRQIIELPDSLDKEGGVRHHSPPKVDSTGVPCYGRSTVSPEAMELLRKRKK